MTINIQMNKLYISIQWNISTIKIKQLFDPWYNLNALNMPANLESSAVVTGLEKVSFHSNPPKKAMPKDAQTTAQLHSFHKLVKQHSKFFKPGFSSMWTVNYQMFKLVLEKAEETEIKLPTSAGSGKKQENSRKTSISAFLTMPKPLTVWITINCGKFWKRWEYQTT